MSVIRLLNKKKIIDDRSILKYLFSFIYFAFGTTGLFFALQGHVSWYLWVAIGVCFAASSVIYFGIKTISPVKI